MEAYNNILVEFDSIIDIDLGLFTLLKKEYNNPKFVNLEYLKMPDWVLKKELIERKQENPLHLVLNKDFVEQADNLYEQFIEDGNYIQYGLPNQVFSLINAYRDTNTVSIDIVCKNRLEEQIINKFNKKLNCISFDKVDIEKYDCLFMRKYSVDKYKTLSTKNIFICNYTFNKQKDISKIINVLEISNRVSFVDVYDISKFETILG